MAGSDDPWTAAMREGRYADAWAIGARTLGARDPAGRDDPARPYHQRWVWDGRPFDGLDVLVRCYHGLGDTIQFARYLPALAARAQSVTVEVQPRLLDLLGTLGTASPLAFVPFDPARPLLASACDIGITELDFALRLAPDAVPVPYLRAPLDPGLAPPDATLALCHSAGDWDPARSIPADLLEPLCRAVPTVTLVTAPTALPVLNPHGCPPDVAATVGLIAAADVVVSVDTFVAHLAGALGKPTWLLLRAAPDWRWNPASECSAWYPTVRQFVQRREGHWEEPIARVLAALGRRRSLAA